MQSQAARMQQAATGVIVTELGPYDVLFGRGSGPNDHEGNIRFRKLVAERKAEYMATNHRMTKAKIAREIVDAVLCKNGRFLKKIEPEDARVAGLVDSVDVWIGVDDDTIMEKAKQALRQNTNKAKGHSDQAPNPPAPALAVSSMHHPPQPSSILSRHDLTYVVDDLEPIPIPSAEFPNSTAIPSPTPAREVGQHDGHTWATLGNGSSVKQTIPVNSRVVNDQIGSCNSNPVVPSSCPQQQLPQLPQARTSFSANSVPSSQQNSMRPPAARARTSLRSSLNSRGNEKSVELSDLMDSFTRTHLGGDYRNSGNSIESMGTIEPLGSETSMSYSSMTSSVFSVLRPDDAGGQVDRADTNDKKDFPTAQNERSNCNLEQEEAPSYVQVYGREEGGESGLASDFMSSTKVGLASDASMSIADLGTIRRRQPSSFGLKDVKEEGYREVYESVLGEVGSPSLGLAGIEAMGSSSLNFLKGVLMSQDELPPPGSTLAPEARESEQRHDDSQVSSQQVDESK